MRKWLKRFVPFFSHLRQFQNGCFILRFLVNHFDCCLNGFFIFIYLKIIIGGNFMKKKLGLLTLAALGVLTLGACAGGVSKDDFAAKKDDMKKVVVLQLF